MYLLFCCKVHSSPRHHSLTFHAHKTFCYIRLTVAVQCSSRSWTAAIFPPFDILLQSILTGILLTLVLLNTLYWTSLSIRWSKISY